MSDFKNISLSFEENLREDVRKRENKFQKDFDKTWEFCLSLMFYIRFFIPKMKRKFLIERNRTRLKVKRILAEYIPRIKKQLSLREELFYKWEEENSGPNLCASETTSDAEAYAKRNLKDLSQEMILKISSLPHYDRYFRPVCNPADMVENPYLGYLSIKRAQNYCDYLLEHFSRRR